MSVFILFVPVDASDFEVATGVGWDAFSSANLEAADYLRREARLLAVSFAGLSLLAGVLALGPVAPRRPLGQRVPLAVPGHPLRRGSGLSLERRWDAWRHIFVGGLATAISLTMASRRTKRGVSSRSAPPPWKGSVGWSPSLALFWSSSSS
jgi:hypothetical protein